MRSVIDEIIIPHLYRGGPVIFVQGGLKDMTLGLKKGPGTYTDRLPGMKHGP
jgi:hypothetical protein